MKSKCSKPQQVKIADKIECQTCGWTGREDEMVAQFSDMEPGCPSCGNNDFMDVEPMECAGCKTLRKQIDVLRELAYPAYRLADGCGYSDGTGGMIVCSHPDVQLKKGATHCYCYEYDHLTCPAYRKLFGEEE